MSRTLRISLVKTQGCGDTTLKSALLGIDGVRIVAELNGSDDIGTMLSQLRPDVLFVALGRGQGRATLDTIGAIAKGRRDVSVILAGPDRDPDLLLAGMRCGVREFVELPTKPEQLLKILQDIIEVQPERRTGKLLAFHRSGGGSGASTVAANVAVEIARAGRGSVALVDLDLHRGQLAAMLDLFPTYTLLDVCTLEMDDIDPARLDSALLKHDSGVRVLARPKNLGAEDAPLLNRTLSVVNSLIEVFDYVVLDMDITEDSSDGQIINLIDEFVLVTQPVINSVRNASDVIKRLTESDFKMQKLKLVLNRVPKRSGSVKTEGVEKSLKHGVFWEIPEDYEAVSEALNLGLPLSVHAAGSKVCGSVRDLALALTRPEASDAAGERKSGLLKRIFKANVA